MASVAVTESWTDPTASLTDGSSYIVQNKSSGILQFYEGSTFSAAANGGDGVLLVPMFHGGAGANNMRWTFDSANAVRMRLQGGSIEGASNVIEFFPAI